MAIAHSTEVFYIIATIHKVFFRYLETLLLDDLLFILNIHVYEYRDIISSIVMYIFVCNISYGRKLPNTEHNGNSN